MRTQVTQLYQKLTIKISCKIKIKVSKIINNKIIGILITRKLTIKN